MTISTVRQGIFEGTIFRRSDEVPVGIPKNNGGRTTVLPPLVTRTKVTS